jgi:hypothetical protein
MAKEDMESTIYEMINKLGGLEKFQSNPFAFIGEVFKHPDLLSKIDALAKTPEMQKQIAESMNNPMFQQMVGNNPLLAGMMENYKNRQAYGDAVDAEIEDDDDDADDEMPEAVGYEYDIPGWAALDWLNPVSNQPFYIAEDADKRVKFADVLEELPEECQERVALIAEKRLEMHVDEAQMSHLESLASKYDLEVMDLMATTGFMGEVCYCATSAMPDDDLCDLAKFALGSLHRRSGYPVASYLTQNLLYLDTFESIDKEDWENFVWSLSANPMAGRDGNFAATWDDASLIADIAADNLADETELYVAVCLGLLGWRELDIKSVQKPFETLLRGASNKTAVRDLLVKCLGGQKIYAMSLLNMRESVRNDAVHYVIANDGLDALLDGAAKWDSDCAVTASILVEKLDLLWSMANADKRDAFLMHTLEMDSEALALAAMKVGVARCPEKYREIAKTSSHDKVRAWAESL